MLVFFSMSICTTAVGQHIHNPENRIKQIDSLYDIALKDLIGNGDQLKELIKQSQEANYPKGEVRGLVNLGVYYTNNSMIDSAKIAYERGEKIIRRHPDLEFILSYIYNNKASILTNQDLHYQALKYFHKSHKVNLKQGDKKMAMIIKMNILGCHLALGEPDKVLAYSKELLADPEVINQKDLKYKLYSNLAMAHFDKKEFRKAINWWSANLKSIENSDQKGEISYLMTSIADAYRNLGDYSIALKKALKAQRIIDNKPELSAYAAANALVLGKIYNSLDNPAEAITHFQNVIVKNPDDPMDIAFSYKNLGAIHKRIESWDTAAHYYEKYGTLVDSLYQSRNDDISKISEGKIELIEEEYKNNLLTKDNDILTYKNEKQQLYIISLAIGFFSLLFILLSWILYRKYYKSELQVELLKENEKKILENHLKAREEEFLATMISVNERLDKLSYIKKNLSSAIKYNNREEIIDVEKRLERFISSTSDLSVLKDRIESQYPGITAQINTSYPDLSTNDVRHCLLMKLNLSIKESAQLLSVSTHAVKMARKRLKKKMNIPDHISLKDHLQNT
ncbi:tetratricopeptide repeat protein [Aquimarina sp. MMG016]|uniref:tetratricopeptide repeat protein n=1 Tax=Aquimarina sp. MMG016 TaxID=2822690 RepID=UPI001B3A177A|nr:tetratricopeptide repeat protein [Aquimarina sp. MMG016]MBQ4819029.1 tetratricopeptide repeat protein [Aquimarina sp. MMG016]